MSLIKAVKGMRAFLKVILRRGPKYHVSKSTASQVTTQDGQHFSSRSVLPKLNSKLLRAVFSRTCQLLTRYNVRTLEARNNGIKKFGNVPVFSLIGLNGLDSLMDSQMDSTTSAVRTVLKDYTWEARNLEGSPQSLSDLEINQTNVIGNGCEGAVFEARLKNDMNPAGNHTSDNMESVTNLRDFDLAIKAVFNYGAESNASSILRELKREIVPLQPSVVKANDVEDVLSMNVPQLPPHPNVVDMLGVFVDDMLVTEQGRREFPAAMPSRVDPDKCFGRNKTLYLVMRKCTTRLSDFLSQDITMRTRCQLLTQLLEAVHHMTSNGVAHRDIKADNFLIDLQETGDTPRLQVCDFGCCLAEPNGRLEVPYVSSDVNLGGNSWLMAPEISCAKPGDNSILDFRKSDLWACGALAYQILGSDNPFYPNNQGQLKSQTYTEDDLPPLPDDVPEPVKKLVKSMLARDPTKRPSPSVAVLVVQMIMWEAASKRRHQTTRQLHRVVINKANRTAPYVHYVNKASQKMGLILAEMYFLIKRLTASTPFVCQDWTEISNFLCLSRLTPSDFAEALKFFR